MFDTIYFLELIYMHSEAHEACWIDACVQHTEVRNKSYLWDGSCLCLVIGQDDL